MPLFGYTCECGHKEEVLARAAIKRDCPACGKEMWRQIGCGGFILSGSGWFRDGYR